MKNNKKILAAMTLLVIFSLFSCQKDDITEELVYSNGLNQSQRVSHVECVDFESPSTDPGETISRIYTNSGLSEKPIYVTGVNPSFSKGSNVAMIFNSTEPSNRDLDLGSPNQVYGGLGVGIAGATEPFANKQKLGNILIVAEDLNYAEPSDLENIGRLKFDFTEWGLFKLHSLTVIDVEGTYGTPKVELFNASGELIKSLEIPVTGDNGVKTIYFDSSVTPVQAAIKMVVSFYGSGGLDNICIKRAYSQYSRPKGISGIHVCVADCNHNECVRESSYWSGQLTFDLHNDEIGNSLPLSIGKIGGMHSLSVYDKSQVGTILEGKVFGEPENGFAGLYRELLVAKLNIANGTDPSSIDRQVVESDMLVARISWKEWHHLSPLSQDVIFERTKMLEAYNKGQLGVLSCD